MEKKPQNTAGNKNENPAPQESKWPNKTIIRYITRALVLLIVFAWALANLDAVLRFLGKVLALFTPFLIGGAIAFLINVVLRPLECCWNKVCRKAPAKLTRPVCLTASTVLVLGILFAVVFMMIPSLRESGDEFIQNIPVYVEEIGRWWTGVVRFAAKYNIVLPEYAIDSDLLIEKVTALISDEGSGILTVTWGAATSVLSVLVDVLLGRHCAGADFRRMDRRRSWHIFDSAGRPRQGSVVRSLSARFTAGGGKSDLSQGGRQVRRTSRTACADGCYDRRRSIRHLWDAVQRSRLRRAVQPLSGVHEESKHPALNDS